MANYANPMTVWPPVPVTKATEPALEALKGFVGDFEVNDAGLYLFNMEGPPDLQDILEALQSLMKAHPETPQLYVVRQAFTCDRAQHEAFGGYAAVVTSTDVHAMDTGSWLYSQFSGMGLDYTNLM